jgi:hypothetical protein
MAFRSTDFPTGREMGAFRAVEEILREDPVLAPRVRTWSTWRGEQVDTMPLVPAMCPYLQMSPVMFPDEPMGEGAHKANFGIRMRLAVDGVVAEDIVNFWSAVRGAVVRRKPFRDTNVLCHLQAYHVIALVIQQPAVGAFKTPDDPPLDLLVGAGMILLKVAVIA